jgi:uncharacterized protein (DUF1800 family)
MRITADGKQPAGRSVRRALQQDSQRGQIGRRAHGCLDSSEKFAENTKRQRVSGMILTILLTCLPAGDGPLDKSFQAREAEHLWNRAGFGALPEQIEASVTVGCEETVRRLLSVPADEQPFFVERFLDVPREQYKERSEAERNRMNNAARERERKQLQDYTGWWVERMQTADSPLCERMVLFWHGYFTSSVEEVRRANMLIRQNQFFRENALGNFRTILKGMLRDPALLTYLDNDANRKGRPNENLARELMELFTLGLGNYTEKDVKEVARALTGRTVDGQGDYAFDKGAHDDGAKEILGQKGKFNGDDVARILLEQPACSRHVARRLLRWFESVEPAEARVEAYAQVLRDGDWELQPFLARLLNDPAFYSEDVVGARVLSPIEYMVGISRRMGQRVPSPLVASASSMLGMRLFSPPNVKGWEEGTAWITTSTLMQRGNIAGMLLGAVRVDDVFVTSDADMQEMSEGGAAMAPAKKDPPKGAAGAAFTAMKRVVDAGWSPTLNFSARMTRQGSKTDAQIVDAMLSDLLACEAPQDTRERMLSYLAGERVMLGLRDGEFLKGGAPAERVLRRMAHLILSLPEAQLG